jgi:hypothetical protein
MKVKPLTGFNSGGLYPYLQILDLGGGEWLWQTL